MGLGIFSLRPSLAPSLRRRGLGKKIQRLKVCVVRRTEREEERGIRNESVTARPIRAALSLIRAQYSPLHATRDFGGSRTLLRY